MPTEPTEKFLAKAPKVPPTFKDVDFADNQAVIDARDAIIREKWVKVMMTRLVREEMGKCYAREGVNHLEKCGKYRERYIQLLKEHRGERGYRGQQQNYVPGADGPDSGVNIHTDFPTVQQAKGIYGSDLRPGNSSGWGKNENY